jgi:hypothetical protein
MYEPGNENEVCILFGTLMPYFGEYLKELGYSFSKYYVEEYPDTFPDCTLILEDGTTQKQLRAEFERFSGNFNHDLTKCDMIICWKNNWMNSPEHMKIIELAPLVSKLKKEGLQIIMNDKPKYPFTKIWSPQEFMDQLRKNITIQDYEKIKKFLDEISAMNGIRLQTGRGGTTATMKIGFMKDHDILYPLSFEASGRCLIGYKASKNKRNMTEKKEDDIRNILNNHKKNEWHIIKSSDIDDLIEKLRKVINILCSPD